MTRDAELERIAAAVESAGLGQFEVFPPSELVDRWDVEFSQLPGVRARGIPMDGRTSLDNLITDIARVAAVRRASRIDLSVMLARFAAWRREDKRRS